MAKSLHASTVLAKLRDAGATGVAYIPGALVKRWKLDCTCQEFTGVVRQLVATRKAQQVVETLGDGKRRTLLRIAPKPVSSVHP